MFFESISEIAQIASRCGTAIFVVPRDEDVEIPGAIVLQPEGKSVVTIEQIRNVLGRLSVRQTSDLYVVVRPAEALGEEAANALLKSLEEPGEKVHFVLITDAPSQLLPTILSRASMYILRMQNDVTKIQADEKMKDLAKRLMVAKGAELVAVADEIGKKKDGVRLYALGVLGTAIEMLYKSYFITGKEAFLVKLPKFLQAYEAISKNGHVKLQIVANLC